MNGRRRSKRLIVAMFCDRFPELSETFVSGEVRELLRQGVDVTVYSRPPSNRDPGWRNDAPVRPLDWPIHRRPNRLRPLVGIVVGSPRQSIADLLSRTRWRHDEGVVPLRRLAPTAMGLRRAGVEHIHVHFAAGAALDAMRLSKLTGIPYSITAHAYELYKEPANLGEKLASAAFVTVPCAYNLAYLRGAGLPVERVHVRMLGTDTESFRRRMAYQPHGPALAVGRLIEKKGFATLIDAAAQRDIGPVNIIGDGPRLDELAKRVEERGVGDRVTLVGKQSPEEIRSWMEHASMLVVPSVVAHDGDRDALPVVIWEALAMELPVVGTRVAGLPEVIRPPWGRVVEPGDARALAAAITDVRDSSPEDRRRAGEAGRRWLHDNHRRELATRALIRLIEGSVVRVQRRRLR
jgi:colanic acid/amylovoran biosynthesis glycosyltransferase